jgi:4-hydroxybenzoate polyprenyltransferase
MFLNDAFDVEFDRQHRRERPIPSGKISVSAVWLFGVSFLLLGWLLILPLGLLAAIAALLLVATILIYDAIHKRTAFAPLLMAACRFLLYFVAAAATLHRVSDVVLWHGLALAAYVTGLSYLARGESGPGRVRRWPLLLLIVPLVANGLVSPNRSAVAWAASVCLFGWLLWCLRGILKRPVRNVGRSVAGLLVGIALVDGAALSQLTTGLALVFGGLFVLALILQRKIPAT